MENMIKKLIANQPNWYTQIAYARESAIKISNADVRPVTSLFDKIYMSTSKW